jgi:hypothetical protein
MDGRSFKNNGSVIGTNNDGGGHDAIGARREQVATRRLYKEQSAMSEKERLAIESVTNWKNFGRRLIKREEDQGEDFLKPSQYTLSSRIRTVSSNFVVCFCLNTLPTPALPLYRLSCSTHSSHAHGTNQSDPEKPPTVSSLTKKMLLVLVPFHLL